MYTIDETESLDVDKLEREHHRLVTEDGKSAVFFLFNYSFYEGYHSLYDMYFNFPLLC